MKIRVKKRSLIIAMIVFAVVVVGLIAYFLYDASLPKCSATVCVWREFADNGDGTMNVTITILQKGEPRSIVIDEFSPVEIASGVGFVNRPKNESQAAAIPITKKEFKLIVLPQYSGFAKYRYKVGIFAQPSGFHGTWLRYDRLNGTIVNR